ncbi:hypothetical protein OE88DRAFT_1662341 [Heliocybe sulcata]|uniref:Uncharacterized protein n=1 Tax=Heliocybe sulcata TaxID=5364 RepID=A0A5C3MWN5_9AGAM|nr:hypothetical protein OE88DRAFT_1662341 [Heliocybe sulcata]
MKFFVATSVSSLFALANAAASCSEAARFGTITVSPTSFSAGDSVTINADFTCSQQMGYAPTYTDYYLEVPQNNNGHEPPVLLARRQPATGAVSDSFSVTIPHGYYFPDAGYNVALENTYSHSGSDGSTIFQVGGVYAPVTLAATVNN